MFAPVSMAMPCGPDNPVFAPRMIAFGEQLQFAPWFQLTIALFTKSVMNMVPDAAGGPGGSVVPDDPPLHAQRPNATAAAASNSWAVRRRRFPVRVSMALA